MSVFMAGILLMLLGLTEIIQGHGTVAPSLMTAGAVAMGFFVWIESRTRTPLIDLNLFKNRIFAFGNLSLFLNALARGALLFLMTFAFQGFNGNSPLTAGLKMLPLSLTIIIVGPIAGRLSDRIGSRQLSSAGLFISAISLVILADSGFSTYAIVALGLGIAGVGNGLFNSPNTSAVMGAVPPDRRGVAASTRTLLFNTGQLFSMGISFAILAGIMGSGQLSGFLAGIDVTQSARGHAAFAHGLSEAFIISAILSLIATVFSMLTKDVNAPMVELG